MLKIGIDRPRRIDSFKKKVSTGFKRIDQLKK
jgi:hypothetical protein